MLSKVSVDQVFTHYFEKMLSASRSLPHLTAVLPWTPLGTSVSSIQYNPVTYSETLKQ